MNPTINPAEREQMAQLSREYHYCLLFVWKLRQGIANKTPVYTLRDFSNWYWKNHIKQLFSQEEKIFLPYFPTDDRLAIQLKNEHNDIRDLVLDIDADPDTVVIALLADFLEQHVRFEERILLPRLENKLSTEQLNTIFQQLEEHSHFTTEWKEEFWNRNAS